jgi:hypothetical protein
MVKISQMYFLLRSEVEYEDPIKNYSVKKIYCPYCFKNQIYKKEETDYYTKYECWNKDCDMKGTIFVVLNDFIDNEYLFDPYCENCQEPFYREIDIDHNSEIILSFECEGKMCGRFDKPYTYNVNLRKWIGKPPKFTRYEDQEDLKPKKELRKSRGIQGFEGESEHKEEAITSTGNQTLRIKQEVVDLRNYENMPLLVMNNDEYEKFLNEHNNKVIILVDLPNFIRTLHSLFPSNFDKILDKAHNLLIDFIDKSYHTSKDYLIRYFSKPDEDLFKSNRLIAGICEQNNGFEVFHMLNIQKSGHFSDIDNYLIANAVEILERCDLRGFVIVSSDKDYLPVMRIAEFKGVKSRILGINTSEIYEKYDIDDIKFLNVLKHFKQN